MRCRIYLCCTSVIFNNYKSSSLNCSSYNNKYLTNTIIPLPTNIGTRIATKRELSDEEELLEEEVPVTEAKTTWRSNEYPN